MKNYPVFFSVIVGIVSFSFMIPAYGITEETQFDLHITSEYFHEPNPNKSYLVMKPGESQQVTIKVTNNDSEIHLINLQMSTDDSLHEDRIFSFEPAQLTLKPHETAISILTVTSTEEANTGTTIWHTLIAKSTTFGAKASGFYVVVHENPVIPQSDMVRRGSPGGMFASSTVFDIDEIDAMKNIPYKINAPVIPDEYLFRGMYGLDNPEQLIYSKHDVSSDTRDLEFWDNGGLLISFSEKKPFTYEQHLNFLDGNQQQVRINGNDGIASGSILISASNNQKTYSNSIVTVFLDDIQFRIESQIPLQKILQIADSMIPAVQDQRPSESMIILENQFIGDFDLAATDGDNVFVVWEEFDEKEADVFLTKSSDGGANFSDKINISKSLGLPRDPIVKATGDYVHVVWYEKTKLDDGKNIVDVYISSSNDNGKTFSEPISLSKDNHYAPITFNGDPAVAAAGNNVYVVWISGQHDWFQTFLASSSDGGKTFQIKRLSHNDREISQNPTIAISGDNVYVGWSQSTERNSYHAKMMITVSNDNGKSFNPPMDQSPVNTTSYEQILYAFDDHVFVSWRDEVPNNANISLVHSYDGGKTFSEIKPIAYGARPNISGDENNIFVAIWCGDEHDLDQICLTRSSNEMDSFSEQIQISNITWKKSPYANTPTPKITSQDDTVYVSWKYPPEKGGQNKMYLASSIDAGKSFNQPMVVGQTDEDPKIIVSEDKMYLIWIDDRGQKNNLHLLTMVHPFLEEVECGKGTILKNKLCIIDEEEERYIGVDDPSFFRQNLQTGETISNPEVILAIQSLGAGLIVLFIVIYAIKKRRKK